jgi:phosphatidylinositol alpha 1,6-mannosyltransferase
MPRPPKAPVPPEQLRLAFFAASMKEGQDGVTRVLYKISETLARRGIEHMFFSAVLPPRERQWVPMVKVPSIRVPFYPEYRYPIAADVTVNTVLHRFRPHLLAVNSPCSLGWAAIYAARLSRRPVVATYHTHFVKFAQYYKVELLAELGWQYTRMFYNAVDETFVPSTPIRDELETHGVRRITVQPHGVDTALFAPSLRSASWRASVGAGDRPVLLYAGRLVWEKDLGTLVAAWQRIAAARPDALLVLAGDGPIREQLRHLLPGAVFLGHIAGEALSACYASADMFVFPSTTETFGLVTLEAMASGCVPVCADAGGSRDIVVNGENGYLARPGDPDDFARRCLALLDDPARRARMAAAALRRAEDYHWEAVVTRMLEAYAGVVARPRRRVRLPGRRHGEEAGPSSV